MSVPHFPVGMALQDVDVLEFLDSYFDSSKKTLFIGNVGFGDDAAFIPLRLSARPNVAYRFMFEERPDVPLSITDVARQRQRHLQDALSSAMEVQPIAICGTDGAPLAGRNACRQVERWVSAAYTDVVLDATGMSRGTCFPVAKLLLELASRRRFRVHLLVAATEVAQSSSIEPVSGDRGDWIHGFQFNAETDDMADAHRLWVVQLKAGSEAVLGKLYSDLSSPADVCPIVPFPTRDPRRGDNLLFDLRQRWQDDWSETALSLIYADESDPTDVYRSIVQLHTARQQALEGSAVKSVTVLSPLGRRLPSIGMLLAAQEYSLPLYYLETVGYTVAGSLSAAHIDKPDHLWCFRFIPQ